ncbi:MAG: pyrimidine dimer DNA glycosylase/endonuclease V [Halioglobus sp.]
MTTYLRIVGMNIFVLDQSIKTCAQYHCDQHVSKMILESVQILCTALNKKGIATPYRSTHAKHPCVLWAEASFDNFSWLKALVVELNTEYRWRYDKSKDHASMLALAAIDNQRFEATGLMPFAQAMPEDYKNPDDAVSAYRDFYCGEKSSFATWKKREVPSWWTAA